MFMSKGSIVILLVVIATCIHVNSAEGLRKKRQSGTGSTPPPSTTSAPASGNSGSGDSGSGGAKPNKGLFTSLGDALKSIPIAGAIVAPILYFIGGILGGVIGFLG